jgi:hypothetical protein
MKAPQVESNIEMGNMDISGAVSGLSIGDNNRVQQSMTQVIRQPVIDYVYPTFAMNQVVNPYYAVAMDEEEDEIAVQAYNHPVFDNEMRASRRSQPVYVVARH